MSDQLGTTVPHRTITEAQLAAALRDEVEKIGFIDDFDSTVAAIFAALPGEVADREAAMAWSGPTAAKTDDPGGASASAPPSPNRLDTGLDVERLARTFYATLFPPVLPAMENPDDKWALALQLAQGIAAEYARLTEQK